MSGLKLPHAHVVNVIPDPPRKILHVGTSLPENPGELGFNAEAKQHLVQAAHKLKAEQGLDGVSFHWGVQPSHA